MPSVKSCFNLTLFRKNLARFWPIWCLYLVLWILALPLMVLTNGWVSDAALNIINPLGILFAAGFGILAAMAVFSYLYNGKSVNLMHSLPIRRSGLFLTNYLSGLCFLLVPNLLVFLLTLLAGGYNDTVSVVIWLVAQSFLCLFFYSFAVFCAMFTGNLLALPVFYGILNFLVIGMHYLLALLMDQFIFGYSGWGDTTLTEWLTPMSKLFSTLGTDWTDNVCYLRGLPVILLYGLLGIVLAVLALVAYRRRKLESAGDIVAISWVRPIFKYGMALCAAVALGVWLYSLFQSVLPTGIVPVMLFLLLGGLLGYFVAEMLLKKSFKVFAKSWKGALACCLVLIASVCAMEFDLMGFNRAPARESVVSVEVYGVDSYPQDQGHYIHLTFDDPADIDLVLQLHNTIVTNRRALQQELGGANAGNRQTYRAATLADGTTINEQIYRTASLSLRYVLASGKVINRHYEIPLHLADLSDPNSPAALLTTLLNKPANVEAAYWDTLPAGGSLIEASLSVYDTKLGRDLYHTINDDDDRALLLSAIRSDMAAGRLGRRYLFDDMERLNHCYYNDISLTFYKSSPLKNDSGGKSAAQKEDMSRRFAITVQTTSTDTLRVLTELGLLDETHVLLTHTQQSALPAPAEYSSTDTELVPGSPRG